MKIFRIKKNALSCTLEDFFLNRFFKIFINVDEIFRELETKILKSNINDNAILNIIFLIIKILMKILLIYKIK